MMSARLIQFLAGSTTARARRPASRLAAAAEWLEDRLLPVGNVAAVVQNGTLTLHGDAEHNTIEVTVMAEGVIVHGHDGTTINGAAGDFIAFAGADAIPGDLAMRLAKGDDVALISGDLSIGGDLRVHGGQGNDRLGLIDVTVDGDLAIVDRRGDTGVDIDETTITGDTRLRTSQGNTMLVIADSALSGALRVKSRDGTDAVHLDNVDVAGDVTLRLGRSDNGLFIEDSQLEGDLLVRTGAGADFVMLEASSIAGATSVRERGGDDALVVTGAATFAGAFRAFGSRGNDAADISDTSQFDDGPFLRRYELDDLTAPVILDRLDNPQTGIRTRGNALHDFFVALLSI
jgi:hypothetical protein